MRSAESDADGLSIETGRLAMRPLDAAGAEALAAIADAEAAVPSRDADELADARAWIARARVTPGASCYAILLRASGEPVGAAGVQPMEGQPAGLELLVWIGAAQWGRGLATEAVQVSIDRAFADPSVGAVWGICRVTNRRARRVIEKCGFQYRENGMARSVTLRGAVPVERFVLERRSWQSLKAWGAVAMPGVPATSPEVAA